MESCKWKQVRKHWEYFYFSFRFMGFVWVHGVCLVFTSVSFFSVYVILMSFLVLAYMDILIRSGVVCTKGQEGVVARESVSHHHRHSVLQSTELLQVYADTGMTQMNTVTGAHGYAWLTMMGCATGSIYSWDPAVNIIASCTISHLVSSDRTINYTSYNSHLWSQSFLLRFRGSTKLSASSRPGKIISSHLVFPLFELEPMCLMNSFWNDARGAEEWRWWAICLLALPLHHNGPVWTQIRTRLNGPVTLLTLH